VRVQRWWSCLDAWQGRCVGNYRRSVDRMELGRRWNGWRNRVALTHSIGS